MENQAFEFQGWRFLWYNFVLNLTLMHFGEENYQSAWLPCVLSELMFYVLLYQQVWTLRFNSLGLAMNKKMIPIDKNNQNIHYSINWPKDFFIVGFTWSTQTSVHK